MSNQGFLSFSAEASRPAGGILMNILIPVSNAFNERYDYTRYGDYPREVFICPVLASDEVKGRGSYKEKKRISGFKKEADLRLYMDFEAFMKASDMERRDMCLGMITRCAEYIAAKCKGFNKELFISDISELLYTTELSRFRDALESIVATDSYMLRDPDYLSSLSESISLAANLSYNGEIPRQANASAQFITVLLTKLAANEDGEEEVIEKLKKFAERIIKQI